MSRHDKSPFGTDSGGNPSPAIEGSLSPLEHLLNSPTFRHPLKNHIPYTFAKILFRGFFTISQVRLPSIKHLRRLHLFSLKSPIRPRNLQKLQKSSPPLKVSRGV